MRSVHASHASRSAFLRASLARSADWCPWERIGGPHVTGKPLQLAVDNAAGTTEATQSALLIERRLALLIGHRKGGLRHLFANLINHGVDLAPHRQIVGAAPPCRSNA
jgi:hypothetical protein